MFFYQMSNKFEDITNSSALFRGIWNVLQVFLQKKQSINGCIVPGKRHNPYIKYLCKGSTLSLF